MTRAILLNGLLALAGAAAAPAQTLSLGVQGALGDYREVSSNLRYLGVGAGGTVWLRVHRLSVEGSASSISYDPRDSTAGLDSFKAVQLDARLGVDIGAGLTVEVGAMRRTVDPELTAQEMGAARIGLRYSRVIGPGATVGVRGNYLAGAKFTGEGSAGLAFELGLLVSAGPQNGRFRVTGDYTFQRIDRKVNDVSVPIQQSLVRIGIAVGF